MYILLHFIGYIYRYLQYASTFILKCIMLSWEIMLYAGLPPS